MHKNLSPYWKNELEFLSGNGFYSQYCYQNKVVVVMDFNNSSSLHAWNIEVCKDLVQTNEISTPSQ